MYNVYLNTRDRPSKTVFIFQFLLIYGYILFSFGFIVYRWTRNRLRKHNIHQGHNALHENDNSSEDSDKLLETVDRRKSNNPYRGYGAIPSHEDGKCLINDDTAYNTAHSTGSGCDTTT